MATAQAFTIRDILKSGIGVPIGVLAVLAMVVLPLPPLALDVLFTFNIALSLVVLMAVFYVPRPLEFGVFPSVLLLATLLRLALNVASTRVVLMHGHDGTGSAGKVIESFGEFVVGGNYAVGVIVFVILTIINFVVVTKGAGRISEVTARFTLDAMPGKQMAIDADLNAGLITQDEARTRRYEVRAEADFYGSMDGASKFARGDATAGLLILVLNMVGGQLFAQPKALYVAAAVIGVMGLIPGMPNIAFLGIAALCGGGARMLQKKAAARAEQAAAAAVPEAVPVIAPESRELSWDDVRPVDLLGLEVGYRLVPLVDATQGGDLLARVRGVRRKLTSELGFLVPPVHIRDNLEFSPTSYRINLAGVPIGEGVVHPDQI